MVVKYTSCGNAASDGNTNYVAIKKKNKNILEKKKIIISNKHEQAKSSGIWGLHGGEYQQNCLMVCDAVQFGHRLHGVAHQKAVFCLHKTIFQKCYKQTLQIDLEYTQQHNKTSKILNFLKYRDTHKIFDYQIQENKNCNNCLKRWHVPLSSTNLGIYANPKTLQKIL